MNTQNAIVTVSANFRSHKPRFSRTRSAKERWTKPVSKAFYEKLRLRCEQIFEEMRYGSGWVMNFMPAVDRYISTGETPGMCDEGIRIVFICLRYEIDMALERSAKPANGPQNDARQRRLRRLPPLPMSLIRRKKVHFRQIRPMRSHPIVRPRPSARQPSRAVKSEFRETIGEESS